ncbi:carboxymuconolactone decarboxylase family protein [Nocardia concava]|uniref:carboxymuconolactone decarboxylase family protein n=1 Tax=Nocardia concava TaxID=257281 RepID=UPI0009FDA9E7|nr:carboxymuconolactone decarboxylase family protein [Nocardia concava]
MSRVAPVEAPYSEALQERFGQVLPPNVEPPVLYRIVARNESLFLNLVDNGTLGATGLFDRGTLGQRLRELLILRTCHAATNDYEWNLHVGIGLSALMGLSVEEIADTREEKPAVETWSPAELLAMELADALVRRIAVEETLFERLREHFDEPTLIEMTQLIGWYTTVAMQVALTRPTLDRYRL